MGGHTREGLQNREERVEMGGKCRGNGGERRMVKHITLMRRVPILHSL
jgi:hypothetical protein